MYLTFFSSQPMCFSFRRTIFTQFLLSQFFPNFFLLTQFLSSVNKRHYRQWQKPRALPLSPAKTRTRTSSRTRTRSSYTLVSSLGTQIIPPPKRCVVVCVVCVLCVCCVCVVCVLCVCVVCVDGCCWCNVRCIILIFPQ